jgi:hypothetical protein
MQDLLTNLTTLQNNQAENLLEQNFVENKGTKKFNEPYTITDLQQIIFSLEDWLLIGRNIKVEPDRIKLLINELFTMKYNSEQMHLCKLWIKYGKWAVSKKDLELSDFFPTKEQISHLQSDIISREYYYKKIQALKNEHLLELSKLRHELTSQPIDKNELDVQFNLINIITNHVDTIEQQKREIRALKKENDKLKLKIIEKELIQEAEENRKLIK